MTQFDLEQKIMNCWRIIDDIDVLREAICDKTLTNDQIDNVLLGLKELYNMRFDQTFRAYEKHLEEYYKVKSTWA